jgi:hypothetical protein
MNKNYFLIILVFGFWSCQKEISSEVVSLPVDVYVAGFVSDTDSYEIYPTYWKNGKLVQLNFDYGLQEAWATSIAVSDNDVYVAGYRMNFSFRSITMYGLLWKNGISVQLPYTGPSQLSSLVVSNDNVYVVSKENVWYGQIAKYWKNDSLVFLRDGSAGSGASSIVVSGNDVYVSGTGINGNGNGIAKYWKNGIPVNLTDGSTWDYTTSIAVSGNNVYAVGAHDLKFNSFGDPETSIAAYWKKGILVKLTDGTTLAEATSIAVSGTDVYVSGFQIGNGGYEHAIATYWKNGIPVNLNDGSTGAIATSIAVLGNDVYIAGIQNVKYYGGPVGIATYWKNGIPVNLTNSSQRSGANSIVVINQ